MIDREFTKRIRLLAGRHETIKTRFELSDAMGLVEHVELQTHDRPSHAASPATSPGQSAPK
jgi:hypothetical protein